MIPDHLYGFAVHAALASKDTSTKVGAILVNSSGQVIGSSCNDFPLRVKDIPERRIRPAKYLFTAHAEANLISHAAKAGISTLACTVYTTHFPCARCASTMIEAGIVRVVVGSGQTSMDPTEFESARMMFKEAGVAVKERDE